MKTTKSKKTQYRGMPSVSGQIRQLRGMHRTIPGGLRNGATVWRVNDMPFGCSNRERLMFETLLKQCRTAA